jgi:hypothetical protein
VVTKRVVVRKYFWYVDPSVQFLLGNGVPAPEGATIHPIAPPVPVSLDDDKIGFTVDVASRLDREQNDDAETRAVIVPIAAEELADSA